MDHQSKIKAADQKSLKSGFNGIGAGTWLFKGEFF
jgi:hypothetical protein